MASRNNAATALITAWSPPDRGQCRPTFCVPLEAFANVNSLVEPLIPPVGLIRPLNFCVPGDPSGDQRTTTALHFSPLSGMMAAVSVARAADFLPAVRPIKPKTDRSYPKTGRKERVSCEPFFFVSSFHRLFLYFCVRTVRTVRTFPIKSSILSNQIINP